MPARSAPAATVPPAKSTAKTPAAAPADKPSRPPPISCPSTRLASPIVQATGRSHRPTRRAVGTDRTAPGKAVSRSDRPKPRAGRQHPLSNPSSSCCRTSATSAASTNQTELQKELDALLGLLLKADRDKELVHRSANESKNTSNRSTASSACKKGVRARTEGGDELKGLGRDQKNIATDTGKLGGDISKTDGDKKPDGEKSPRPSDKGQPKSDGKEKPKSDDKQTIPNQRQRRSQRPDDKEKPKADDGPNRVRRQSQTTRRNPATNPNRASRPKAANLSRPNQSQVRVRPPRQTSQAKRFAAVRFAPFAGQTRFAIRRRKRGPT